MKPILRYYGSKHKSFKRIAAHFPRHKIYVEPFGGSGSVMLNKSPAQQEIYNELDVDLFTLFRVMRSPRLSSELKDKVQQTPWDKTVWQSAFINAEEKTTDMVTTALHTLVRSWMSFSPMGTTYGRTGYRSGLYDVSDQNKSAPKGHPAIWQRLPDRIEGVHRRLNAGKLPVSITNDAALDVIREYDGPETLFYLDPPYVHSTRGSDNGYRHEMDLNDHGELIDLLKDIEGAVILSGYPSALYTLLLKHWQCIEFPACVSTHAGGTVKTECLWLNQACLDHQVQSTMFEYRS